MQAVLIGPDDDGIPLVSPNAVYLGRQPRNVVRGALLSCIALCNMSVSESFGIVLLEAWLAGKPVIANKDCSAFHDMAIHEKNAILVKQNELQAAIQRIVLDSKLGQSLAKGGKELVSKFSWTKVTDEFIHLCQEYSSLNIKH